MAPVSAWKPLTAIRYVVPDDATNRSWLAWLLPAQVPAGASSLLRTAVSAPTALPVYTASVVLKSLPQRSSDTVPLEGAVHVHQAEGRHPLSGVTAAEHPARSDTLA